MSNPFDNKIKESLENFEMPYDAAAWEQFAQQLPAPAAPIADSSGLGIKAAATIAIVATTVATIWYFSTQDSSSTQQAVVVEQSIEPVQESSADRSTSETVDLESSPTPEAKSGNTEASKLPQTSVETVKATDVVNIEPTIASQPKSVSAENSSSIQKPEPIPSKVEITTPAEEKPFSVKFLPSTKKACVGDELSFINESSDKTARLLWDFGDGNTSTESNPNHSFVNPGTYTVSLKGNKGSNVAEHAVKITVNPTPMPIFSASKKLEGFVAIPLFRFTTAVQSSETAVWNFSDGTRITGNAADHLFRDAGTASVSLNVTNTFGCSSSMSESYELSEAFNLIAPNTFTPNSDGINDIFIPEALPEMGIAFEMTITDPKTGQVVYRTANAMDAWNGSHNNIGPKLDEGIYIWTVVLKENIAANRIFNGKINLTR